MKKSIFLLLLLLFLPLITMAQEAGKDAVVAASNMNILYMGIPNPVEIAVPGIKPERVTAEITNGTITKTANGWEVVPAAPGESVISVLVDNKIVCEKKFRIKLVPKPVAVFAGKNSGTISKADALKNATIEIALPDFEWDLKFRVESFSLISSDNIDKPLVAKGNKLTVEMISVMTRLQKGQKVIFDNILAKTPSGNREGFAPIVLKID
jgi:hypothetical protein